MVTHLAACAAALPEGAIGGGRFAGPVTATEARTAQVRRAGAGLGWTMVSEGAGRWRAVRAPGVVLIEHDGERFWIRPITQPPPDRAALDELEAAITAQSGV